MSEKTAISWTDSTVGFWSGCTKVSPGCANCYAEARDRRHLYEPVSHWGPGAPRLKHKGAVKSLLAMNRKPWVCDWCGESFSNANVGRNACCDCATARRRKVFLNQQADWLDHEVPIEWLAEMLDTIRQCPELDIMLLTKRPELWPQRMQQCIDWDLDHQRLLNPWLMAWLDGTPPANVMLGTTVEDQKRADERIPELLKIPAKFRFLSVEPQLEDIVFPSLAGINLLINGGESGKNARPFNLQWARNLRDQCKAAGVGCCMKQLGSNAYEPFGEHGIERIKTKHPAGADPSEWPAYLRIQEPFSIQR